MAGFKKRYLFSRSKPNNNYNGINDAMFYSINK